MPSFLGHKLKKGNIEVNGNKLQNNNVLTNYKIIRSPFSKSTNNGNIHESLGSDS